MQSWSIVIFCFNEVDTVGRIIEKSYATLEKMGIETYEVIVVDDGSTDGSREVIKTYFNKYPNLIEAFHSKNLGIGHALRTGYFKAKNENICAVPADGQFDLDELIPFKEVPENSIISFFRKENTTYNFFRNSLSKANKQVNLWLNGFELKDVNWVKIYKNDGIRKMQLEIESSLVESEICAKFLLMNYEIREIESKYLQRTSGVSKGSSFKIVLQALRDTLYLSKVLRRYKREK
ncbi:MAG: Undecaprenyl-phosphate 4-deoxy-4-formamido-L-arabinose transferase [Bacteroidota bacterium]|jgi:glycosyltransferase involved in cell wall biosynthesis